MAGKHDDILHYALRNAKLKIGLGIIVFFLLVILAVAILMFPPVAIFTLFNTVLQI